MDSATLQQSVHCDCPVGSPAETKLHGANCSLALLKCPWQWREPFLDERRAKLKRKVGDGYLCDPVDPEFVDHLLPGSVTKLFRVMEQDEQSQIQLEIRRLNQAKATAQEHTSKWDHDDNDLRKPVPSGSESPITVAAPVCSGEELAYLDSILVPDMPNSPKVASSPSTIMDTEAVTQTLASEEPLLQLLSDRYDTYLNYDEEELSFAANELRAPA
ncbi:hypothetical protein ACHHYP_10172 [Achlya hypogyna]|uniref:Uncharacterized protein n=1 Tax=Achlya hypogyna TaxID=1202772 RepID=A0A1V9ZHY5_ACHHY|nr:hypothetical protein ACHHYP_10172 [Achlya hypogyna]